MKNSKLTNITGIVLILLGAVMCLGAKLVFHACAPMESGMWMNCHKAENAAAVLGAVTAVLGAAALLVKNRGIRSCAAALAGIAGIAAAVLPNNVIHLCMMEDMRCHAVMRPAVIIVGVLSAIAAAAFICSALLSRSGKEE